MVPDLDVYLFDLRGYLHLEGALTTDEVQVLNDCLDEIPALKPGEWYRVCSGTFVWRCDVGDQLSADLRGGRAV